MLPEELLRRLRIGKVEALAEKGVVRGEPREPGFLQAHVVIRREAVDADHPMALGQKPLRHMEADEARRAGDKNGS